ncbi:zinc finger protein 728 [Aplysia californica]|uniref:Zinc finger protein 728 n=1 Tax=Aplysia californica TaxID=6500 RepID=A0ABM0JNY0_APLCA|nr:zinc finger protein 728 [Aplysia californica]
MSSGRDVSSDDIDSIANLLRTFLPDNENLPKTDNTSQLLHHVESTIDSTSSTAVFQNQHNLQVYSNEPNAYAHAYATQKNEPEEAKVEKSTKSPKKERPETPMEEGPRESDPEWEPDKEEGSGNSDSDATIDIPLSEITAMTSSAKKKSVPGRSKESSKPQPTPANIPSNSVKRYVCFICDAKFSELEPHNEHMKSHCFDPIDMKCFDCGERFNRRTAFNVHRRLSTYELWVDKDKKQQFELNHGSEARENGGDHDFNTEHYICNECGCPSYRFKTFLKHVRSHKMETPYVFKCSACPEGYPAPCQLRQHIDSQHSLLMPFQCDKCLRRFKLKCSLVTHTKFCEVNPESIPYVKEMQFIDQLSQQRKYQGTDGEEDGMSQFSCPICTVMFDSPQELQTHLHYHDETKPYKCEECGRGFSNKRALQKHESLHQSHDECWCKICGVQLLTKSGYNAHLRGHRNQEMLQAEAAKVNAPCPIQPPPSSSSESAAEILMKIKVNSESRGRRGDSSGKPKTNRKGSFKKAKSYACPVCGMLFHSGGEKFQAHARREHKDAEFEKCKLCFKSYLGKENLARHLRLHQMYTTTFTCDDCGKVFRRKYALQVHKKLHTFKKFVSCDICGQEFRFVSEVDKHKHTKHRYDRMLNIYKCSICGQRFPMLSHLSVHCHSHNMPDAKPFECDLCKISYSNSTELKQHIYQKHDKLMNTLGEAVYIPSTGSFISFPGGDAADGVVVKPEDIGGEEQGEHTNKTGNAKADGSDAPMDLSASEQKNGTDGVEVKEEKDDKSLAHTYVDAYNWATRQSTIQAKYLKRYVCEVCDKAFSSNSDLKTHRRTHSGETPFKCDYCERSFKQRGHRKLHIQVAHTKEMPYKCHLCDSAFPTRYRYQVHVKRHSGVREFKCNHCEKEYYTFGKLNEHKKKRHQAEWQEEQAQKLAKAQ